MLVNMKLWVQKMIWNAHTALDSPAVAKSPLFRLLKAVRNLEGCSQFDVCVCFSVVVAVAQIFMNSFLSQAAQLLFSFQILAMAFQRQAAKDSDEMEKLRHLKALNLATMDGVAVQELKHARQQASLRCTLT